MEKLELTVCPCIGANGSRLGEVGDLKAQSLKLITNFNK
jgi:hypothetical protein